MTNILSWTKRAGATAALFIVFAACSDLLDIEAPNQVATSTLEDPVQASLLVNSAVADFECAFVGYIVGAGLHGDELANAHGWAAYWDFDRRTSSPGGSPYATMNCASGQGGGIYTPLSTARFQADNAVRLLEGWTDAQVANRASLIATAAAYSGYSLILLGEGMCSTAIDLGPELTRAQTWDAAKTRFDKAITAAQTANNTEILNMARVGRARAKLNLGDLAGAQADAALVPSGFIKNATYGDTPVRRYNHIHNQNVRGGNVVIEDDFQNLTVEGVPDTRVAVQNLGTNTFGVVQRPWWITTKYNSLGASVPIARYAEAQLIVAEGRGGQQAVDIINALRAGRSLPPYTGGVGAAEVRDLIIQERARELFLESQHLGDKLRYNLPFTPAAGTTFPYIGGQYGNVTCFPLPLRERQNNPNVD
jgi:hypothetical protein